MSKNIVVITSMPGAVDISYQQYCFNTWEWWCKKNNVELFILDKPLSDTSFMKPTWQRWYVFDILEANGINCDKVAAIDVDTMVRWDCPNFFDLTEDKFSVVMDQDNIGWVKQSLDGYKKFFKDIEIHWLDYFNTGFVVMSKKHRKICNRIIDFWDKNNEQLIHLQNTISKGTDQTPVNYIAKGSEFDVKYLPKTFNLTHFDRKEILNDLVFIDCGYVWHFNGFDKSWRLPLMRDTWNKIRENYEN